MKKYIFIAANILLFTRLTGGIVFATTSSSEIAVANTTPTQPAKAISQAQQEINTKLNSLSENIASKVAQLKLVEKKGIIGTVIDSTSTHITLKDRDGKIHFVDVDELTQFSSPSVKNFGISDVSKNSTLGVLGLYNKESRRILARFVTVLQFPTRLHGAIAAIDKTNFTVTIVLNDGSQSIIEIEDVTKLSAYDNVAGVSKLGFSKLRVGERVYVVGYPDKQNTKLLITARLIAFPTLAINPAIGSVLPLPTTPILTDTPTPSPTKKVLQ